MKHRYNALLPSTLGILLAGCSLQGLDQYGTGGQSAQGGSATLPNNTAGTHTLTNNSSAGTGGGSSVVEDAGTPDEPEELVYSDAGVGQNIVPDPGFELGILTGWSCWGGCEVALNDEINCYEGSQCLKATNRSEYWGGPAFDIRELVQPNRPYEVRVQVATSTASPIKLTLKQLCEGNGGSDFIGLFAGGTQEDGEWMELSGTFYAPTCTTSSLHIIVEDPPANVKIYLDEFYITLLE